MKVCNTLSSLVLLSAGFLQAASPTVGRVSSTEAVTIRGVSVPAQSLTSWPVALHDDIATQQAPARIEFQDGSSVAIQRASKVRIEGTRRNLSVRVLEGSMVYELKKDSHLQILSAAGEVLNNAMTQASATAFSNAATTTRMAPLYSRAAGNIGIAISPAAVSTGKFLAADTGTASATGTRIVLPSGVQLFVTIGPNNVATITSIQVPVDLPNGQMSSVSITSGTLIGATVNVNTSTTTSQPLTITAGGTTLSGTQTQSVLQNSATTALQSAISSGQLPPSTTVLPPSPVSTGQVSPGSPTVQ